MSKQGPLQFLIANQKTILKAYGENEHKSEKTWKSLQETFPDLSMTMSLNTFRQYISVLIVFTIELDKVIQKKEEVIQKLHKARQEKTEVEAKLKEFEEKFDKVIQKNQTEDPAIPKRISGWSIQKSKDGYYRCYRKIDKKVHSVYIGKRFNAKKAMRRILKKETKQRG